MLVAYMDESGHSSDSKIVSLGGFIGNHNAWEQVAIQWKKLMHKYGDVVFHMADLESSKGEFEGWSKERREQLLVEIFDLLNGVFLVPFGSVTIVEEYKGMPEDLQFALSDPWILSFQMCLGEIGNAFIIVDSTDMKEKIAVFCDRQLEFGGAAAQAFNFLAEQSSYKDRLGSFTLASKTDIIQLQLADLVAYECKKLVENTIYQPSRATRWPMQQLQRRPFVCNYLDLSGRAMGDQVAVNEYTLLRRFRLRVDEKGLTLSCVSAKQAPWPESSSASADITKVVEFLEKNLPNREGNS